MKTTPKTKIGSKQPDDDLLLEFADVHVQTIVNPEMYSQEEADRIEQIVQCMSKRICIDKSYVDFPENKHQDTFIELDGWRNLCSLLKKTKYGSRSTDAADEIVVEAFKTMVSAYLYSVLESFGYDIESITVDFVHGYGIDVKFYKDAVQEWKSYPGPWQDWSLEK